MIEPVTQQLTLLKKIPCVLTRRDDRLYAATGFSRTLIDRFKMSLTGARWAPESKEWHFPITKRNLFQLSSMAGLKPHDTYKKQDDYSEQIIDFCKERNIPIYAHQVEMVNLILNGRRVIVGAEMGTGKTLASIVALEMMECSQVYWVGPKAPIEAVKKDFRKWKTELYTTFVTYDGMKKDTKQWVGNFPDALVFDESSKLKNLTTQRTEAAFKLSQELDDDALIVCLTGTPAPKRPTDYYAQVELVCPGFIKERDPYKFRARLAFMESDTGADGHAFSKVKAWRDSEDLCEDCGEHKDSWRHATEHAFVPSVNEIERLGNNLAGLLGVWYKKDCTDLPELRFEKVFLEPSASTLQMAETTIQGTSRGCDALLRLRTISDGFRYIKVDNGARQPCTVCDKGKVLKYIDPLAPHEYLSKSEIDSGKRFDGANEVEISSVQSIAEDCATCGGTSETICYDQEVVEVNSPKLEALQMLMQEHEEVGRLNVFAGFTGSINRIVKFARELGWTTFKIDGKGWEWNTPDEKIKLTNDQMLTLYQKEVDNYPDKVLFVGHPMAAGMGLTLHAAPTSVFYSNDFSPENRIQACARGHRLGMLPNGGLIVDLIHLETDELVIESLNQSLSMQTVSMNAVLKVYKGTHENSRTEIR